MNIFVAASYSSQVDYETGEVYPEYKAWLEGILNTIDGLGHTVFCSLRSDGYKINDADPVGAYRLDIDEINKSDAILALLSSKVSAGVQTEIGVAIALNKRVILAHDTKDELAWFNAAMLKAGVVTELELPFDESQLEEALL